MCRYSYLLLVVLFPLPSWAVDLGDLNVAASRIPTWYPFDETIYDAAQSWAEYDVTCTSAEEPCASGKDSYQDVAGMSGCSEVTTSEIDGVSCMVDGADANTVLYFPGGTYAVGSNDQIDLDQSNIVIRGAGRGVTIFNRTASGKQGSCNGASFAVLCDSTWDSGSTVDWTAGYDVEDTSITVSDGSGFSTDDWVLLNMTATTDCVYADYTHAEMFHHIDKLTNVSGDVLTLERGLRMTYSGTGCTGHTVEKITPIENVGIEDLTVKSDAGLSQSSTEWFVLTEGVVNSWIVDSVFDRNNDRWLHITNARSLWIQGNDFTNLRDIEYNVPGIAIRNGATDVVFENNTCSDGDGLVRTCHMPFNGAEGLITAYNHFDQDQTDHDVTGCERAVQIHGKYTREILVEGNSMNCAIQLADNFWGRQGERIVAYRNRNYSDVCTDVHDLISVEVGDRPGTMDYITEYLSIIGNSAGGIGPNSGSAGCDTQPGNNGGFGDTDGVNHAWVEKNFWRRDRAIDPIVGTTTTRSCGVSEDDSCPGTNAKEVDSATAGDDETAWDGNYPTSLYRTSIPSWWCREACAWDQTGIGAFGDDFSGTLCKLPAQIRYEDGTCTAVSIVPGGGIGGGIGMAADYSDGSGRGLSLIPQQPSSIH